MCSSCRRLHQPLFTKIFPNGESLVVCADCLRQEVPVRLEVQIDTNKPDLHHCRVGLQYQSLRPRLLKARPPRPS
jgi:hypothetical protein